MPDWMGAIPAILVTVLMCVLVWKGANESPENSSPLEWVFNGLKWYLVLAFLAVRDRKSNCKVTHMIAASEVKYYGSIQSDEDWMHIQSCTKHQNIFKKEDAFRVKPRMSTRPPVRPIPSAPVPLLSDPTIRPRPPKGRGGGSRGKKVMQLQVGGMIIYGDRNEPGPSYNPPPMSVGEADNKRLEHEVRNLREELDVTKQELEKLMKIADLDLGEKRSRQNRCKHRNVTTHRMLDGSRETYCDDCGGSVYRPYMGDMGPN